MLSIIYVYYAVCKLIVAILISFQFIENFFNIHPSFFFGIDIVIQSYTKDYGADRQMD